MHLLSAAIIVLITSSALCVDENLISDNSNNSFDKLIERNLAQSKLLSDNGKLINDLKEEVTLLNETTIVQKSFLNELLSEKMILQKALSEQNDSFASLKDGYNVDLANLNKSLVELQLSCNNDLEQLENLKKENVELKKNLTVYEDRISALETVKTKSSNSEKLTMTTENILIEDNTRDSSSRQITSFTTERTDEVYDNYDSSYDDEIESSSESAIESTITDANDQKHEIVCNDNGQIIQEMDQNIATLNNLLDDKMTEVSSLNTKLATLEADYQNLASELQSVQQVLDTRTNHSETLEAVASHALVKQTTEINMESTKLVMILTMLLAISIVVSLLLVLKLTIYSRSNGKKVKDLPMKPTDRYQNSNYY